MRELTISDGVHFVSVRANSESEALKAIPQAWRSLTKKVDAKHEEARLQRLEALTRSQQV